MYDDHLICMTMLACCRAVCATYTISSCQTALPLQVSTEKSRAQDSAECLRAISAARDQQHVAVKASESAAYLTMRGEEAAAGKAGEYVATCMQGSSCQDRHKQPCVHL